MNGIDGGYSHPCTKRWQINVNTTKRRTREQSRAAAAAEVDWRLTVMIQGKLSWKYRLVCSVHRILYIAFLSRAVTQHAEAKKDKKNVGEPWSRWSQTRRPSCSWVTLELQPDAPYGTPARCWPAATEGTHPRVIWIHSNQDLLTDGQQEAFCFPGLGRMTRLDRWTFCPSH